jgi:hypothetical protein
MAIKAIDDKLAELAKDPAYPGIPDILAAPAPGFPVSPFTNLQATATGTLAGASSGTLTAGQSSATASAGSGPARADRG